MASSYTTSYGIEKIGSGEQSGAWGTTTNHNLDLLDRIAAYTSVALSGTTHTLTVREASPGSGTENLQDGMYRVIKFTGALGGNNTVTIAPNTSPAFFFIHNATTDSGSSGPYSVILTQGSGANITVANGKNAIIYCDGGGSGAIVVDAVSNLALATVTASGDVTSAGTVNVTGDTAAGDDASMGYTSAEGLILTGQGSTNDVTIKNDADADVITIATGGTNVDIVGDVTASTINADGDTAASDNAAMGYTAAEGLILTGQGSTNDVTIKNDADADVITIATGGTNVAIAGDLTITGDDLFMATNTSGAALIADGTNFNPVVISGDAAIATNGALTIADNAVSLAKMAGGTDGNIISFDTSGNPVAVATGTDGQVLTSSGAGAVCAFEDAGGGIAQVVHHEDGTYHSGTTAIPDDDTIPQITEGDEIFNLAITPTNASSTLLIQVVISGFAGNTQAEGGIALFQDSTAGALGSCMSGTGSGGATGYGTTVALNHYMTAGTTSATTFRVRIGRSSGTTKANTTSSSGMAKWGGNQASNITIMEILP
jgi:hypothetical protein